MNNKKNSFFTFCFSCVPGAGEMYLGHYRHGLSIMLLFWGGIALAWLADLPVFLFLIPITWFYSFLHTHNLRNMTYEQFSTENDLFLWDSIDLDELSYLSRHKQTILAALLIFIGCSSLWNQIIVPMLDRLLDFIPSIFINWIYYLPQIAIALLLIYLGIRLIIGKGQMLYLNKGADDHENP